MFDALVSDITSLAKMNGSAHTSYLRICGKAVECWPDFIVVVGSKPDSFEHIVWLHELNSSCVFPGEHVALGSCDDVRQLAVPFGVERMVLAACKRHVVSVRSL